MQLTLHTAQQETASGNGTPLTEPDFKARALVVNVSAISLNLLGNISFKVQHSSDGDNWFDVSNLATGNITATGNVLVSLSSDLTVLNNLRIVWTFSNANSVTFSASILGIRA